MDRPTQVRRGPVQRQGAARSAPQGCTRDLHPVDRSDPASSPSPPRPASSPSPETVDVVAAPVAWRPPSGWAQPPYWAILGSGATFSAVPASRLVLRSQRGVAGSLHDDRGRPRRPGHPGQPHRPGLHRDRRPRPGRAGPELGRPHRPRTFGCRHRRAGATRLWHRHLLHHQSLDHE
jgi:hypothetical protein